MDRYSAKTIRLEKNSGIITEFTDLCFYKMKNMLIETYEKSSLSISQYIVILDKVNLFEIKDLIIRIVDDIYFEYSQGIYIIPIIIALHFIYVLMLYQVPEGHIGTYDLLLSISDINQADDEYFFTTILMILGHPRMHFIKSFIRLQII